MRFSYCEINKNAMVRVELVTWEQRRCSGEKILTAWPPEEPTKRTPHTVGECPPAVSDCELGPLM